METKAVLETDTQLPFAVDAAVLEQVAQFRCQQQASLELASLELDGPPDGGGKTTGQSTEIEF